MPSPAPARAWMLVVVLGIATTTGACVAHTVLAPAAPVGACEIGDAAMARDVLYFGRNRPDGGVVSDDDWQRFLDEVVTPRFPDGLTVFAATGRWKGKSGVLEQERSEVVMLLHSGDEAARGAVREVAAEYKRRFGQEAVLRERTATCARFQ